ncbi:MAG: alpha-E domain-containing protein [Hespellia sp.]|nr:alpha-E domain-containing protein [Hespellia sp.]
MGIISINKLDNLYWLGRYTERVYTSIRKFYRIYDSMIEAPEGEYKIYCEKLNIPDIYSGNTEFLTSYIFSKENPDSLYSNMSRAYDNAIVLREELSSNVLAYVQLALDTFETNMTSRAPLLELQSVIDYLLAFWGCVDDYVEDEDCRNIMKCGKYVERMDLYIRLDYHIRDIEKEFNKLANRIHKTHMYYNIEKLDKLADVINEKSEASAGYQEALNCLDGIIEVK